MGTTTGRPSKGGLRLQSRFGPISVEINARSETGCGQPRRGEKERVLLESARVELAQYRPTDAREQAYLMRLLDLLETPEPWSRSQFRPGHLTASAFVISPARDALLLIFHRKLGIWIQPGGHVEPADPTLEQAARREVAEEVGVDLADRAPASIFDVDVHTIPARKTEPEHEHFDVRFCFQAKSLAFAASSEVVEARWVELARIDQVTADESVLRAARKLPGLAAKT
jgi:8-oxo-dGTP pyrophosphatase MutT (NUDIX family)